LQATINVMVYGHRPDGRRPRLPCLLQPYESPAQGALNRRINLLALLKANLLGNGFTGTLLAFGYDDSAKPSAGVKLERRNPWQTKV
jgi:hypothetical protein